MTISIDPEFVLVFFVKEKSPGHPYTADVTYVVRPVLEHDGDHWNFVFRFPVAVPGVLVRAVCPDVCCWGKKIVSFDIGRRGQILVPENKAKDYTAPMSLLSESSKIGPMIRYDPLHSGEVVTVRVRANAPVEVST